jgi:L-aminopeptidase/D-esterase-like protein
VFDLGEGRADVRPGPDQGRAACDAVSEDGVATGRVGAGTGATVGKWAGREYSSPGGLGIGRAEAKGFSVSALAVVNSVGDVIASDGTVIAGTTATDPELFPELPPLPEEEGPPGNTVLCVATVHAALEKRDVRWLASRASDGVTATVRPAHTRYDGDVAVAIAAPPKADAPPVDLDILAVLTTEAVAAAVRNAVSLPLTT